VNGYDFHPEALADLDEIWEFVATESLAAADRVIQEILSDIDLLVRSPIEGTSAPI